MRPALRFAAALALSLSTQACDRPAAESSGTAGGELALANLGRVPDFTLTDQTGKPLGSQQLRGKPYLAAFMFTRCPTVCPRLTANMKKVKLALTAAKRDVAMLSISVDPEYDSPAILTNYAAKHGADLPGWSFLTGDYQVISETAEQGFKIGLSGKADPEKPDLGITHGSHLVLVDAQGDIRGYFRTSDSDLSDRVLAAVKQL